MTRVTPTVAPLRCCWPIGEPRTPEFHFCRAEARPGSPYCAEHHAVAHVSIEAWDRGRAEATS